MDGHSKNVFLIGALHMLCYIMFSLEPLTRAIKLFNDNRDDDNVELSYSDPIYSLCLAGFSVLMAILAGLMIRGVLKASVDQRHVLIAPFLVAYSLVSAATVVLSITHLVLDYEHSLRYIEDGSYAIGILIIILYPIYTLFFKLRSQFLKEKSLENTSFQYEKKPDDVLRNKLCV